MKQTFAQVEETVKELRAYVDEAKPEYVTVDQLRSLYYEFEYLHERLSDLWMAHYDHLEGHLPNPKGAGQMRKALKALGLDDDYEVQPRVIYAADGRREALVLTIPLKDK